MFQKSLLLFLFCVVSGLPVLHAQEKKEKLALLFQNIFGPRGLVVDSEDRLPDGSTHSAHFNSAFQSEFTQFNVALASRLTAVPLPSPASGLTYTFDSATGTFKRSTQSFGPILSDRAETIGKKKYSFGFNYQLFTFDTLEGIELFKVPAVFTHDDFQLGGGRADVVTTENSIEASVGQFTAFITYGISDRLDLSVAIPAVRTRLSVVSNATIQRIGTASNTRIHFFRDSSGEAGDQKEFFSAGTASGLGDIILRLKGRAAKRGVTGLALGLDVRLPTGDEKDLLGSGALGIKPFAALSFSHKNFSPHINVGYQWNGRSLLAGDVKSGIKTSLPDQVLYAVGADLGIEEKFTLAFDILGQWLIDTPRLVTSSFTASGPAASATFPDIRFLTDSYNTTSGSIGFKTNLAGRFLVNFNVIFKLDNNGLRDRVTPLVGIEYSF